MCTEVIKALAPLNRTLCIDMYEDNARSRLFCRLAKRSIVIFGAVVDFCVFVPCISAFFDLLISLGILLYFVEKVLIIFL